MPRSIVRSLLLLMSSMLLCAFLLACGSVPNAVADNSTTSSASNGYASAQGSTPEIPDPTGLGIFNVRLAPFSAKGDGLTDDTLAIRVALTAACQAGGGEVYFPKGTYIISPQALNEKAALTVNCDGITFAGAGVGVSVISRMTLGDSDPDQTCPLLNGQVNRGAGIWVAAKTDGDGLRHSFTLSSLSLLGNRKLYTGMTGSGAWPATQHNCFNVWDVSDKGLLIDPSATDIQVVNAEIAYFSGELVYSGGGLKSTGWLITRSNLHHSNGDAISVTAGVQITGNQLHDVVTDGIENMPYGANQPQTIMANSIYNIGLDAVNLLVYDPNFYNNTPPTLEVASNQITTVHRYGVVMMSRGGSIHDNQIYDVGMPSLLGCGIAAIGMQAPNGVWEIPQNIAVNNNTIEAKTVTTQCGIEVYTPAQAGVTARNISITGNTIAPVSTAAANGIYMLSSIFIIGGTQNVTVQNNIIN